MDLDGGSRWSALGQRSGPRSDERYTPSWLLEVVAEALGGIDLDPCADPLKRVPAKSHFTLVDNGLEQAWEGTIYINPPFSNTADWVRHLSLYWEAGKVTAAIALLPVMALCNKSAQHLVKYNASAITLLERTLVFLDEDYKEMKVRLPFPCALVYLGINPQRFLETTRSYGVPCLVSQTVLGKHRSTFCTYCGKPFLAQRSTAKYCSPTCRVQLYRKKSK